MKVYVNKDIEEVKSLNIINITKGEIFSFKASFLSFNLKAMLLLIFFSESWQRIPCDYCYLHFYVICLTQYKYCMFY